MTDQTLPPPRSSDRWAGDSAPLLLMGPEASASTLVLTIATAGVLQLALRWDALASMLGVLALGGGGAVIWSVPGRRTLGSATGIGVVMLLATNLVLRASPWVTGPTVIAGGIVLLLTSRGTLLCPRRMEAILAPALSVVHSAAAIPFLGRPLVRLAGADGDRRRTAARATLIAVLVVGVLSVLLASGDVVFGAALTRLGGGSAWTHVIFTLICALPVATLALHAQGSGSAASLPSMSWNDHGHRGLEAIVGLAAAVVVLGAWGATQLVVALGGADHVLAAENLTRAQYARAGFFQLVVVASVVIGLLNLASHVIGEQHRRPFLVLASALTVETLALIAVTCRKLDLYVDAFGLTMLRLSVACFLGWLALVLVIVAMRVLGVLRHRRWTPTASLLAAVIVTVGFGWANPAAVVADVNIDRAISSGADDRQPGFGDDHRRLDVSYLLELGPDAAPTLERSLSRLGLDDREAIRAALCTAPNSSHATWNLGTHRASAIAEVIECA